MQKERELKRQQAQAKKEAEAQARLLVLKVKNPHSEYPFNLLLDYHRKSVNVL